MTEDTDKAEEGTDKAEENGIVLVFSAERVTKRTVLFKEDVVDGQQQWSDEDVAIGALYIKKQALKTGFDVEAEEVKRIKVTIELIK